MHAIDQRAAPLRGRLRYLGVVAAVSLLLTACGGAAAPAPTATAAPTVAQATLAPATPAPTATTAAAVVNIEAGEAPDGHFYMTADRLAVPAGKVTFNFVNKGKLTHEVMVYPVQDITTLLALHRQDSKADEAALLKGMAGMAEDIDAGKSATFSGTLAPGFYELACHARSKDPAGKTFTHFDKGQFLTLAVIGPGGPAASVTTPASTLSVEMKGDEAASWLFVPDRLVVTAGEVAFKVTNNMKVEHDFVVSPVIDTTVLVTTKIDMGMAHGFDYGKIKGTELLADLAPGKSDTKTLKLAPGLYVAACYMVGKAADGTSFLHRDRGQRFVFEVK
ncbi:MAG TPA: hypothetical protein VFC31_13405 [Candidatus Limnocylindria bacterium]|nr:hypothetical protein [Candidatus Limnocylindria bacterium]